MDAAAGTLLLVARLLVMGPEGTHLVSEHRAEIPAGATGLIRETLAEPGLPGAVDIYVTPRAAAISDPASPGDAPIVLKLREEVWTDPAGPRIPRPPDETNSEEATLAAGASALSQIAETADGSRRLMISFALRSAEESAPAPVVGPQPAPRQVALRIDAYLEHDGARELREEHVLLTLAGYAVSWQTSIQAGAPVGGSSTPNASDRGITITLRPLPPVSGWISVEAELKATGGARSGEAGSASNADSRVVRTVPIGIPFELSVRIASLEGGPVDKPPAMETWVLQVTPYLPIAGPQSPGG